MTFGGSAAYSGSRRSRSVRCASRQSRTQSRPGYVRMKCAELASLTLSRTESETSCLVARWFTTSAPCAAKHAGRADKDVLLSRKHGRVGRCLLRGKAGVLDPRVKLRRPPRCRHLRRPHFMTFLSRDGGCWDRLRYQCIMVPMMWVPALGFSSLPARRHGPKLRTQHLQAGR